VAVATLPFNLGVGGALRTGFRYAVEDGYDSAVQFDGDGQHDPSQICRLVPALDAGADMVIGSRFASHQTTYEVGRVRSGAMRLLRVAVKLLSGHHISDTSSGFRAFSRPMLEFFARNYPQEYLGDTVEALLLAAHSGFQVVEVPVAMRVRSGGVPSSRNVKLLYHYVRLLIVLVSAASVRKRKRVL
jgi:glycosyltransferase involved in cell wall biosynthesis